MDIQGKGCAHSIGCTKISHLGMVAKNLDLARSFFSQTLGLEEQGTKDVALEGVRTYFLGVGNSSLELLEPLEVNPSPAITSFKAKFGGGVHHIALEVKDFDVAITLLKDRGVTFVYPDPRLGAHGGRIRFIPPSQTGGFLVEITEKMDVSV